MRGLHTCFNHVEVPAGYTLLAIPLIRLSGHTVRVHMKPSAFAQRVRREAERRGSPQAQRCVVLGDGARWIWSICQELFPGAIQIVDLWHTCERLWSVSKELHAGHEAAIEAWA